MWGEILSGERGRSTTASMSELSDLVYMEGESVLLQTVMIWRWIPRQEFSKYKKGNALGNVYTRMYYISDDMELKWEELHVVIMVSDLFYCFPSVCVEFQWSSLLVSIVTHWQWWNGRGVFLLCQPNKSLSSIGSCIYLRLYLCFHLSINDALQTYEKTLSKMFYLIFI